MVKAIFFTIVFHIVFPSRKTFSQEILLDLVQKTKDVYVFTRTFSSMSTTASFDL
jgi:hypothetical protein